MANNRSGSNTNNTNNWQLHWHLDRASNEHSSNMSRCLWTSFRLLPPPATTSPDWDLRTGNRPKHDHLLGSLCAWVCVHVCVCVWGALSASVWVSIAIAWFCHWDLLSAWFWGAPAAFACSLFVLSAPFRFRFQCWVQFPVSTATATATPISMLPAVSLFSYHCKNVCSLLGSRTLCGVEWELSCALVAFSATVLQFNNFHFQLF